MDLAQLEIAMLKLAPRERARLAQRLLASLESLSEQDNEQLWLEEADRRDAELDSDPTKARPADAVFSDARARLG